MIPFLDRDLSRLNKSVMTQFIKLSVIQNATDTDLAKIDVEDVANQISIRKIDAGVVLSN